MKKILVFILISGVGLLYTSQIRAQQTESTIGFAISPAIIELAGEPGETFLSSVTFANTSEAPEVGFVSAQTLIPIDNILDQGKRSQFDASSWISLDEPNHIFEPDVAQTIEFTVTIPEQANPGGHYALITLSPGVVQNTSRSDTLVIPEISASILITVAGDIDEQAEIVEDDLQISRLNRNNPSTFSFRIRNIGNVHILPSPKLSILKDGKPIDVLSFQPQLVLPNTEKIFTTGWPTDVDYGKYSLKAEMTYGSESIPLASTQIDFWVLPAIWQAAVVLLLFPFLIIIFLKRKNIPRVISVLRGTANFSGAKFKRPQGDERLPQPSQGTRAISDIAKEIESQPQILGLPDNDYDELFEPVEKPKVEPPKKPAQDPIETTSSKVMTNESTTFITQTQASTIVRELSQFFNPDDIPEEKPKVTKIKITTTSQSKAKKAPKPAPNTPKKINQVKKVSTKKPAATKKPAKATPSDPKKNKASPQKVKKSITPKKKTTTSKKTASKKLSAKTKPKSSTAKK